MVELVVHYVVHVCIAICILISRSTFRSTDVYRMDRTRRSDKRHLLMCLTYKSDVLTAYSRYSLLLI